MEEEKAYCYHCDQEFENEDVLDRHQKSTHFKCQHCHEEFLSVGGMAIHVIQTHRETQATNNNSSVAPAFSPGLFGSPVTIVSATSAPTSPCSQSEHTDVTFVNSKSCVSGPNNGRPSIGPLPMTSNRAPTYLETKPFCLVWDDEAFSMEEKRAFDMHVKQEEACC